VKTLPTLSAPHWKRVGWRYGRRTNANSKTD
jgi:hypothetical protein